MRSAKFLFRALGLASMVCSPAFAQKEAAPEAPKVAPTEPVGVRTQAGVGSEIAFGRAGVVELGGSAMLTSAEKLTTFSFAPSVGYFFADNLQISGILNWQHSNVDGESGDVVSLIAEPSFHYPFTNEQFMFVGLGAGVLFPEEGDTGFAISPRVGFKNLVGRSGMITIDARGIYSLNDTEQVSTSSGTVLTVKSAYGVGVGYTVLL